MTVLPTSEIPWGVPGLFIGITLGLAFLTLRSLHHVPNDRVAKVMAIGVGGWLLLLTLASLNGFYSDFSSTPPRIVFLLVPPTVFLIYLCKSESIRPLLNTLNLSHLTYVQTFRVGIEVVLWQLVVHQAISPIMTFTGQNFDIIVGLTAPLVGWLIFKRKVFSLKFLRLWNFACIGILMVTVASGVLSAPTLFRVFYADISTAIIGTFPYALLPGFVVPFAFACHILSIRKINTELKSKF